MTYLFSTGEVGATSLAGAGCAQVPGSLPCLAFPLRKNLVCWRGCVTWVVLSRTLGQARVGGWRGGEAVRGLGRDLMGRKE